MTASIKSESISRRQILAGSLALASMTTDAQERWPTKAIKLVVAYPPGGGVDGAARLYAPYLSTALGVPVIIDNKPGADGIIGCDLVARSPADGYTLLVDGPSHAFNVAFGKKLPYNPSTDLIPVGQTASQQLLLVSPRSLGLKSTTELIAMARKAPGALNYGATSNSTALPMELFKSITQTDIRRISYKGTAAVATALLAGEVQVAFAGAATVYEHVKSGRLIAFGIGDLSRSQGMPEISTLAETGVNGFQAIHWSGIFGPRGMPQSAIDKINEVIVKTAAEANFRKRLVQSGFEPPPLKNAPADWGKYISAEQAKWSHIVKTSGLTEES